MVRRKAARVNGKQCIHPSQVEITQKAFGLDEKEVMWAVSIVIADGKADKYARGAWMLVGKMIEVFVIGKAKSIVSKADLCGFDVKRMRDKWKDQDPG